MFKNFNLYEYEILKINFDEILDMKRVFKSINKKLDYSDLKKLLIGDKELSFEKSLNLAAKYSQETFIYISFITYLEKQGLIDYKIVEKLVVMTVCENENEYSLEEKIEYLWQDGIPNTAYFLGSVFEHISKKYGIKMDAAVLTDFLVVKVIDRLSGVEYQDLTINKLSKFNELEDILDIDDGIEKLNEDVMRDGDYYENYIYELINYTAFPLALKFDSDIRIPYYLEKTNWRVIESKDNCSVYLILDFIDTISFEDFIFIINLLYINNKYMKNKI